MGTALAESCSTADGLPHPAGRVILPNGFFWTEEEKTKTATLAGMLNCSVSVAQEVLVYFLCYIRDNPQGLAVARLPEVLAPFPVKWGYKKKRNDFLQLMHELDFIYVKVNYWAKIRAKKYAPGQSGQALLDRLALPIFSSPRPRVDAPQLLTQPHRNLESRGEYPL